MIFCIGGGEIKNQDTYYIDKLIVDKLETKKIGFISAATDDSVEYYRAFSNYYKSEFECESVWITVKSNLEILNDIDGIYVGGGSTKKLMQYLLPNKNMFIKYYLDGKVLSGISAGCNCWFEYGISENEDKYEVTEGLGFIKGVVRPHYKNDDKKFNAYKTRIKNTYGQFLGIEEKSAYIYDSGKLIKIINET